MRNYFFLFCSFVSRRFETEQHNYSGYGNAIDVTQLKILILSDNEIGVGKKLLAATSSFRLTFTPFTRMVSALSL